MRPREVSISSSSWAQDWIRPDSDSPRTDTETDLVAMLQAAGFAETISYGTDELNSSYLAGRDDGLVLRPIERVVTAVV